MICARGRGPLSSCCLGRGSLALGAVKGLFEWSRGKQDAAATAKGATHKPGHARAATGPAEAAALDKSVNGSPDGGCAEGSPLLTNHDESTKTPGLFLVGPAVRHGEWNCVH